MKSFTLPEELARLSSIKVVPLVLTKSNVLISWELNNMTTLHGLPQPVNPDFSRDWL